jgi:hypothetical protein
MMERRFECRFLCADLVRVDWLAGENSGEHAGVNSRTVEAVLEDISALGACVQVEERIPPGAAISISVRSPPAEAESEKPARFSGHVSYCVYRDYGYFVGIRFSDENRWSSGVFEPQHLTNLEALKSNHADELAHT